MQQTLEEFYQKKLGAEKSKPLTLEDFYQKKEEERKKRLRETKPADWRKQLVGELVTKAATQSKKMRFLEPMQTPEFWKTAGKNLVKQASGFLEMVMGLPAERPFGVTEYTPYYAKPTAGEVIKEKALKPAWGLATFVPQTALDLTLDPIATARDKPLDTLFFLSIVAKAGYGKIKSKIQAGETITGKDLRAAIDKVPEGVLTIKQKATIAERLPEQLEIPFEQLEMSAEAGGLAYGMEVPKKVAGVRIDKLNAPYDVQLELTNLAGRMMKELRQERVPWEETVAKAEKAGITVEKIVSAKKGQAWNAAQLEAARRMQGAAVKNLIEKKDIYAAEPTDANLLSYRASMERAGLIARSLREKKAQAGRALNILRKPYEPGELKFQAFERILKELGGREKNVELVKKFSALDIDNPVAVNKFLRNITKSRLSDKVFEVWVNSILSGPVTQMRNIVSNAFMLVDKPVTSLGAALVEAPKRLLKKPPEVYFGESPSSIFGALSGLKEGVRKAIFAFQNEMTMEGASKIETRTPTAVKGPVGRAVRLPGRGLIAMDEFFKGILNEADLHSLAYRMASKEGLKGKAKLNRIAQILHDPPPELIEHATGERLARTFQKELGEWGKGVYGMREKIYPLRYIAPFIRTPINIPKQAFYRSPLNLPRIMYLASKGKLKGAPLAEQISMAGMGSLTAIAVFMMAKEGMITGSAPTDKNERELFWRTKQPYSIKIGGKWYSYTPIEPLATLLGITADAANIWEMATEGEKDAMASKIIQSVTQNFSNKTFLQGANMFLKAFTDPERGGERWLGSLAGSAVPSAAAQTASAMDPYLRDAQTVIDAVKARIPKIRETLPLKYDVYGRAIKREGAPALRMISPFYYKTEDTTPIDIELARLKVFLGQPSRMIGKKKMTPQDYSVMSQGIGEKLTKMLKWTISQPSYKLLNDEGREKLIRSISAQIRGVERIPWRDKYKEE